MVVLRSEVGFEKQVEEATLVEVVWEEDRQAAVVK